MATFDSFLFNVFFTNNQKDVCYVTKVLNGSLSAGVGGVSQVLTLTRTGQQEFVHAAMWYTLSPKDTSRKVLDSRKQIVEFSVKHIVLCLSLSSRYNLIDAKQGNREKVLEN